MTRPHARHWVAFLVHRWRDVSFFFFGMGWGLMTLRLARMTVTAFGCIIWVLGNGLGVGGNSRYRNTS